MGLFSWLWNLLRSIFKRDVRMQEIKKDIDIDKQMLRIDRERKKIEKFENNIFRILSVNAHIIFDNTNRSSKARNYRQKLYGFIQKVHEIRDSPGIRVEFTHLRELSSIWQSLLPHLERDFPKDKKIQGAIKTMNEKIRLLAEEIKNERRLLTKEEKLVSEKEALEKKEE